MTDEILHVQLDLSSFPSTQKHLQCHQYFHGFVVEQDIVKTHSKVRLKTVTCIGGQMFPMQQTIPKTLVTHTLSKLHVTPITPSRKRKKYKKQNKNIKFIHLQSGSIINKNILFVNCQQFRIAYAINCPKKKKKLFANQRSRVINNNACVIIIIITFSLGIN